MGSEKQGEGRSLCSPPSAGVSFTRRELLSWCCRGHSLWALLSTHGDVEGGCGAQSSWGYFHLKEPIPGSEQSLWFHNVYIHFCSLSSVPQTSWAQKTTQVPLVLSHSICPHQVDYRPCGLTTFAWDLPEGCVLVTKDRIWPGGGFWVTWHQN